LSDFTYNDGSFTIRFSDISLAYDRIDLEIIDITGKLVYKAALKGKRTYQQNLGLPAGMYFARIKNEKISGVKSFVVK